MLNVLANDSTAHGAVRARGPGANFSILYAKVAGPLIYMLTRGVAIDMFRVRVIEEERVRGNE